MGLSINNGSQAPCSPISSNCVVWQGPDLPCINLCKGDTISDVIAKLAVELCDLIDQACQCEPDLVGLDLKCVLPSGQTPPQTLKALIQLIIDYICELTPGGGTPLPVVALPPCLYYDDPVTGNPIVSLPLDQYAAYLAGKICNILTSIEIINQTLLDIESRLVILENCVLPCTPNTGEVQVISQCIIPGGLPVNVSTLLLALESAFCNLQDATGDPAAISQTINQQCLFATTPRLSGVGNYGSLPGWQATPSTLAQSVQNIWIALCDMYSAITNIQENCCDSGCEGVQFGFTYVVNTDGAGIPTSLNLNFTSSVIPPAFNDCGGGTLVTITDSASNTVTQTVNVKSLSTNPSGINIALTGLNVYQSLLVHIAFCVTDGVNLCSESRTQIIPLQIPCPNPVTLNGSLNSVDVSFTNSLGAGVVYVIKIADTNTGVAAGSTTINSPGATITHTFTGLASATSYTVTIEITSGGVTRICPGGVVSTIGSTCTNISSVTVDAGLTINDADIVLGYTGTSPGGAPGPVTYFGYHAASNRLIVDTFTQDCGAPIISSPLMGMAGSVTITLAWPGAGNETAIVTEYSSDNVTWSGTTSGGQGLRTINTGITSGKVYIRAKTECTGPDTSIYAKIMYNYATSEWFVLSAPSECPNPSTLSFDDCPYGADLGTSTLTCGSASYTVPGYSTTGQWFYFGVFYIGTTRYYAYAGWSASADTPNAVYRVVLCCECPAFIIGPTVNPVSGVRDLICYKGGSIVFSLDYVIGSGLDIWTVILNGMNGSFTQLSGNSFSYTHNNSNTYGDTMTVRLNSSTPGCATVDYVVQVQIIPCTAGLTSTSQPIFAFIDTDTIPNTQASEIATAMTAFDAYLNTTYGWTGQIYIVPVQDSQWLGYPKSIVDDGASALLDPDPTWVAIRNLPSTWPGGSGVLIDKTRAFVIAFSNESYSEYHDSSLAAGWGSGPTLQPTLAYKTNYDEFQDILNGPYGPFPGTYRSTWASLLGFIGPQFPDGFTGIYYPINNSPANATAAAILQGLACYVAEMIQPEEYGVQTAVDVTAYLMDGVTPSATNPYQGAFTPALQLITGLFYDGWVMFLNQKEPWNYGTDSYPKLQNDLEIVAAGCDNIIPPPVPGGYKVIDCITNEEYYVGGNVSSLAPLSKNTYAELTNTSGVAYTNWAIGETRCFRFASFADPQTSMTVFSGPWIDCTCS